LGTSLFHLTTSFEIIKIYLIIVTRVKINFHPQSSYTLNYFVIPYTRYSNYAIKCYRRKDVKRLGKVPESVDGEVKTYNSVGITKPRK
jgi:hypothetical protein